MTYFPQLTPQSYKKKIIRANFLQEKVQKIGFYCARLRVKVG
jgi:hypothetical protein